MTTLYMVGGAVRDGYMGITPKDIDYSVEAESYEAMRKYILDNGGEIFLETPEYFTIRAKIIKNTSDYVLCRKDGEYTDNRRPDIVEIGTIYDDLERRDFTMNAIAVRSDGVVIDPHNGRGDISKRIIRCVGNTYDRMNEDSLRMVRALRFSITKEMKIHPDIERSFSDNRLLNNLWTKISVDRVKDELMKMFQYDTVKTLRLIAKYPALEQVIFTMRNEQLWLKPTMEKR